MDGLNDSTRLLVTIAAQTDASFKAAFRDAGASVQEFKNQVNLLATPELLNGLKGYADAIRGQVSGWIASAQEMEKYRGTLRALMHDTEAADKQLQSMVQFAATTPFNVANVVAAGVAIKSMQQSIDDILPLAGNLASVMNRDIREAALLLGKAATGSQDAVVQMADAWGISRKKLQLYGAEMSAQGGIATHTAKSLEKFNNAWRRIISEEYGEAMTNQAKTMTGAFSNFEDSIQRIQTRLGNAMLPRLTQFYTAMSAVIGEFEVLDDASGKWLSFLVGWGGGITGVVALLIGFAAGLGAVWSTIKALDNAHTQIIPKLGETGKAFRSAAISAGEYALALAGVRKAEQLVRGGGSSIGLPSGFSSMRNTIKSPTQWQDADWLDAAGSVADVAFSGYPSAGRASVVTTAGTVGTAALAAAPEVAAVAAPASAAAATAALPTTLAAIGAFLLTPAGIAVALSVAGLLYRLRSQWATDADDQAAAGKKLVEDSRLIQTYRRGKDWAEMTPQELRTAGVTQSDAENAIAGAYREVGDVDAEIRDLKAQFEKTPNPTLNDLQRIQTRDGRVFGSLDEYNARMTELELQRRQMLKQAEAFRDTMAGKIPALNTSKDALSDPEIAMRKYEEQKRLAGQDMVSPEHLERIRRETMDTLRATMPAEGDRLKMEERRKQLQQLRQLEADQHAFELKRVKDAQDVANALADAQVNAHKEETERLKKQYAAKKELGMATAADAKKIALREKDEARADYNTKLARLGQEQLELQRTFKWNDQQEKLMQEKQAAAKREYKAALLQIDRDAFTEKRQLRIAELQFEQTQMEYAQSQTEYHIQRLEALKGRGAAGAELAKSLGYGDIDAALKMLRQQNLQQQIENAENAAKNEKIGQTPAEQERIEKRKLQQIATLRKQFADAEENRGYDLEQKMISRQERIEAAERSATMAVAQAAADKMTIRRVELENFEAELKQMERSARQEGMTEVEIARLTSAKKMEFLAKEAAARKSLTEKMEETLLRATQGEAAVELVNLSKEVAEMQATVEKESDPQKRLQMAQELSTYTAYKQEEMAKKAKAATDQQKEGLKGVADAANEATDALDKTGKSAERLGGKFSPLLSMEEMISSMGRGFETSKPSAPFSPLSGAGAGIIPPLLLNKMNVANLRLRLAQNPNMPPEEKANILAQIQKLEPTLGAPEINVAGVPKVPTADQIGAAATPQTGPMAPKAAEKAASATMSGGPVNNNISLNVGSITVNGDRVSGNVKNPSELRPTMKHMMGAFGIAETVAETLGKA